MWNRWAYAGWALLAAGAVLASQPAEESYLLREEVLPGSQWRTELDMKLAGTLVSRSEDKATTLKLAATARHRFAERVLGVDAALRPNRVLRHYGEATSEVHLQGTATRRTLRPDRRLQVAQKIKDETVSYSPSGPLTHEEHELTGDHFDVLGIHGLFPEGKVAPGQTWEVPVPAILTLAGLDGLTRQEMICKLESVENGMARVRVQGAVEGIDSGADVRLVIEGSWIFDLANRRLVALEWKQTDERQPGPVTPELKTETTTTLRRTFEGESEELNDAVAGLVPAEPEPGQLLLTFRDPKGRWEFLHDRQWHVVARNDQFCVLRLLDKGELVGQVNVLSWPKAKPGSHLNPDEIKKSVLEAPHFTLDQVLQAGEMPSDGGQWIYRLSFVGRSNDTQVMQNYYAVAGPQGDQVLLIFTTEVNQAERLGDRDLSMVGTVTFPTPVGK